MAKYDTTLQTEGAIFLNGYKDNAKKPDYLGSIKINRQQIKAMAEIAKGNNLEEVECKIALWNREARESGKKYKYCKFEVPQDAVKEESPAQEISTPDPDDYIPWE